MYQRVMLFLGLLLGFCFAKLFHQLLKLICCLSHCCLLFLNLATCSYYLTWVLTGYQLVARLFVEIQQIILEILHMLDLWKPLPLFFCLSLLLFSSLCLFLLSELLFPRSFCLLHLLDRFLPLKFHCSKYWSVSIWVLLFDDWCLLLLLNTLSFSLFCSKNFLLLSFVFCFFCISLFLLLLGFFCLSSLFFLEPDCFFLLFDQSIDFIRRLHGFNDGLWWFWNRSFCYVLCLWLWLLVRCLFNTRSRLYIFVALLSLEYDPCLSLLEGIIEFCIILRLSVHLLESFSTFDISLKCFLVIPFGY